MLVSARSDKEEHRIRYNYTGTHWLNMYVTSNLDVSSVDFGDVAAFIYHASPGRRYRGNKPTRGLSRGIYYTTQSVEHSRREASILVELLEHKSIVLSSGRR